MQRRRHRTDGVDREGVHQVAEQVVDLGVALTGAGQRVGDELRVLAVGRGDPRGGEVRERAGEDQPFGDDAAGNDVHLEQIPERRGDRPLGLDHRPERGSFVDRHRPPPLETGRGHPERVVHRSGTRADDRFELGEEGRAELGVVVGDEPELPGVEADVEHDALVDSRCGHRGEGSGAAAGHPESPGRRAVDGAAGAEFTRA